ncbi:outer membrane biosynthesis protein TonB [Streptococcus gallinaceus]|uniref:transglutaminase domain-containing protein n=1 Tax=Streptococcus gallinaceus TaxID=165758 RepID=UPI0020A09932|nr:transglutaminase domain-containing protein [Streptococcus gallinaceus]MCP1638546.1 outer membrane biosynthesis protein TonB [Streptococcus gallinaceus]MCP1769367.1 outer membrane biosynthesis protein TonB [Streptococcus gallinaceus]
MKKKNILKGLLFSTMVMASVAAAQVHADDHFSQRSYYTYVNEEGYQATRHFLNQKQAIIEDVKGHISSLGDVATPLRDKIKEVNQSILSYEREDHQLVYQLNYGNNTADQYNNAVQKREGIIRNIFEKVEANKAELENIRTSYHDLSYERTTLINQIFSILGKPSSRRIHSYRDAENERENLIRSLQQYMDRLLVVQSELSALAGRTNAIKTDDLSAEIGKLSGILLELTGESAEETPVTPQPAKEEEKPVTPQAVEEEDIPAVPQAVEEEKTPVAPQVTEEEEAPVTPQPAKEEETPVAPQPAKEEETPVAPQPAKEEETPVKPQPAKEEAEPAKPQPAKEEAEPAKPQPAKKEETPAPTKPATNYNIVNDALNLGTIADYTALTNGLTHAIDNKVGTIRYKVTFKSREQVDAYAAQLSKLLEKYADDAGTILRIRTSNQLGTYYRGNSVSHIEVETTLLIDYTLMAHQKNLVAEYKDFVKQVVKEQITDKNITDDYEKAKILNQFIIDNYEYADHELNTTSLTRSGISVHAPESLYKDKRGVCQAYAVMFRDLAVEAGLKAWYVTGATNQSRDANHAWNIVEINGVKYYVDTTWNDVTGNYRNSYFLVGRNTLSKDHSTDRDYADLYNDIPAQDYARR